MISLPRKKLIPLLSSPFLLAAIPSLILFLLMPVKHERYSLDLKAGIQVREGYWHSYCDLDGDGNSSSASRPGKFPCTGPDSPVLKWLTSAGITLVNL